MTVHIVKPYREDKDLGRAYNEAMRNIGEEDFACLCDLDTMFLTPDAGKILHDYAEMFPEAGMFTCVTNRIHPLATDQLLGGKVSDDRDVYNHIILAENQREQLYQFTEIGHVISGFLMLVSKKMWNEVASFPQGIGCLGVDNYFSAKVLATGRKIYRMNGLYVWHTYRMLNGITDKSHLR